MLLNRGPSQLAIPGPSVMPDRVLRAMHRPSPNIYAGELIDLTNTLYPDLKTVARTSHNVAIYIANGHGAWEAAVRNTLNPGDKAVVLSTGRFGAGWAELAQTCGVEVELVDFGMQSDADPNRVEEILRADTENRIKAVLTVQADTATSVKNDIKAIGEAIANTGHDALYMVDCIASLACDRFEMDAWGVDVMVAGCQKGLMTPPGLSFVYFNEKVDRVRKNVEPGFYWDWVARTRGEIYYQKFAGTAPTQHLYGLREALDMLVHEEGMEAAWQRHEVISGAVWQAIDAWGEGGEIRANIDDRAKRSCAVTTVETGDDHAYELQQWTQKMAGLTLGIGLGFGAEMSPTWKKRFRIGHMGHQNVPMVMGVLGTIDAGLKALNVPHGDGALAAAAQYLAARAEG